MFLLSQALDGNTVSFSRETCHCPGAVSGMGLADSHYDVFPGGREAFAYFLSSGNEGWETGRSVAEELKQNGAGGEMLEDFIKGEGFKKNPEMAHDFLENIPPVLPRGPFVVLEPLAKTLPEKEPEVVIFLADSLQLSALVYMANFARRGLDNVRIPFGSGCQSIGILPIYEGRQDEPKAIVGLTDISARLYLHKLLGRELLSFAMPWRLFLTMEDNVDDSFLKRHAWLKIREKLG